MTYRLRDAAAADLSAITTIYRDCVLNGTASYEIVAPDESVMAERFAAITDKGYPYIAATDIDGALLGYAYASAFRTRPAYRWVVEDSIYLAHDARGKGIGRALLVELVERCTLLGFRQMIGVVGGAHPASIAVHRSAGFAQVGLLTGTGYKHGRWLDTVLMQRSLGDGNSNDPDLSVYPATLFGG